jgi:Reverse transcriptase (RNA-dependent DNA polymerase)
MVGYGVILGYPWLRDINPDTDWVERTWAYRQTTSRKQIQIIGSDEYSRILARGNPAYVIVPQRIDSELAYAFYGITADASPAIPEKYQDLADVFSEEADGVLPDHAEHDHPIDVEPGKEPPFKPLFNLSEKELKVFREYLTSALERGFFFIPKKDGTLRLCVDYRELNAMTIKNRHPLPLIGETLDRLSGAKHYTKLDLRHAYHRVRIRKGDEAKTAFRIRYGHFEYLVMPFGLANAPATFQANINKVLKPPRRVLRSLLG